MSTFNKYATPIEIAEVEELQNEVRSLISKIHNPLYNVICNFVIPFFIGVILGRIFGYFYRDEVTTKIALDFLPKDLHETYKNYIQKRNELIALTAVDFNMPNKHAMLLKLKKYPQLLNSAMEL